MKFQRSFDWRSAARTTLSLSLSGTGWLLTHVGRLLEGSGELVNTLANALNSAPLNTRRE